MSDIIASTYEQLGYIGEGGGNIFLARHLRLDKMVVMKADMSGGSRPQFALMEKKNGTANVTITVNGESVTV